MLNYAFGSICEELSFAVTTVETVKLAGDFSIASNVKVNPDKASAIAAPDTIVPPVTSAPCSNPN